MNDSMREFYLERLEDESGVSGTGNVARGIQLPSGKIVLEWCTHKAPTSIAIYESPEELLTIHGHEGKTLLKWVETEDIQVVTGASYRKGLRVGLIVGLVCLAAIAGLIMYLI